MRQISRSALLAFFILGPTYAVANPQCDAVLRDGVMQRQEWQSSEYSQLVLAARFSRMSYQEARRQVSAGVKIPIKGIPVGGSFSESTFNKWKEEISQSLDVNQVINNQSSVLLTSGDPLILQAWTTCISQNGGLTLFLEPRGSTGAVVKLEWTPHRTNPNSDPQILSFSLSGADVAGDRTYATRGARLGIRSERFVPLRRPADGAVHVVVDTDFGGREAYLPAKVILPEAPPRTTITIPVTRMTRGSGVEVGGGLAAQYGADVLHNAPPYSTRPNAVEFDFDGAEGGSYRLDIEYAALQSRPVEITLNGSIVAGAGLANTTGGWGISDQRFITQADVELRSGRNTLRLYRNDVFPHIRTIRFTPIN